MSRVRHLVTCSSMTWVSDTSKIPGSNSGKELGTVSYKGSGKHPGKNSGKKARQGRTCKTRRFLCFEVNPS
jgi:hypothetical protein